MEIISKQLQLDISVDTTPVKDRRPDEEFTPHQHIHFNLLCHKGVVRNIPTLTLFKEFTTALWVTDPMLTTLPYEASKQHYSSFNTSKQIQTIDAQRIHKFFRSYYQQQLYSLSGFSHVRTAPFRHSSAITHLLNGLTLTIITSSSILANTKKWYKLELYVIALSWCIMKSWNKPSWNPYYGYFQNLNQSLISI